MVSTGNDKPTDRVATGIDVSGGSTGTIVERNTTSGNDDTGIQVYSGSTGTIVRRNVTYDNGDHGVDLNNAPGTTVVSNTSVGNFTSGLNVEGGSTNVTLRNNISVDDATNSPRAKGNIRVDAGSVTGTTIDRDLVFQTAGSSTLVEWAGTNYVTLAAAQAGTGQEAHGVSQAPLFASLAARDLRLTDRLSGCRHRGLLRPWLVEQGPLGQGPGRRPERRGQPAPAR